jgi:3-oxoacyl-[acyl-carrier protein] reductase
LVWRILNLQGRVALVTGAGRRIGIGAAICRALAAEGADVFFTYWNAYDQSMYGAGADEPSALRDELRGMGVRCESASIDLSAPDAATRVLDAVERRLGLPSILVNNAAHSTSDGYERLDAATIDAHYAVNMRTTMLLSVEFARRHSARHSDPAASHPEGDMTPAATHPASDAVEPAFAASEKGGRIINLTSGQSRGPMPSELAYIATKGAVEAFTVSLSPAVAPLGITVNAVNPGPTDTGWMSEDLKRELLPHFPQGRIGQPDDVARLVAFLAGDAAGWITGQIIHSEGGFVR